jgi:hypothetical protein
MGEVKMGIVRFIIALEREKELACGVGGRLFLSTVVPVPFGWYERIRFGKRNAAAVC